MAVDLAMERARSGSPSRKMALEPMNSYGTLLAELVDAAGVSPDILDHVTSEVRIIFSSGVGIKRPMAESVHGPRLIRERSNCPRQVPEAVLGLLNVGLIYHNQGQVEHSVSTYVHALVAWIKVLPVDHRPEQVLMVICGAIGAALESSTQDEVALAVYLLGVAAAGPGGEETPELGYCHGCVGSVLFHMHMYDEALRYFRTSLEIRCHLKEVSPEVAAEDEVAVIENNIGACSVAVVDNVYGMACFKSAHTSLRERYPPNHAYVCCVAQNMERAKLNLCNHEVNMALVPRPIFRSKKEKKSKGCLLYTSPSPRDS
eukprot:TRINITY_DN21308_c0_g1_i3.p1 TRINITY_DN21308_c0_g1~~TRINITY_DN21308_c0_g1_i3.p1  ORF type:complete len:316 (-),score=59.08 TRINITY_DN21308_c0_g1_i3:174-1121(-)